MHLSPPTAIEFYKVKSCPDEKENVYNIFMGQLVDKKCLGNGREQWTTCKSTMSQWDNFKKDSIYLRYLDQVRPTP